MTDKEVMQMALDAFERLVTYDNYGEPYDGKDVEGVEAIEALRTALAQQNSSSNISSNSEPVAWMYRVNNNFEQLSFIEPPDDVYDDGSLIPLYTALQRKEWVGLTHEEHMEILTCDLTAPSRIAVAEALLKEKNT